MKKLLDDRDVRSIVTKTLDSFQKQVKGAKVKKADRDVDGMINVLKALEGHIQALVAQLNAWKEGE